MEAAMHENRGSILVEFAILFPVMLLLIVGGIDVGMVMLNSIQLEYATEAAAKCFATKNINCSTAAMTYAYAVERMTLAIDILPSNFTVSTMACGGSVTANYIY